MKTLNLIILIFFFFNSSKAFSEQLLNTELWLHKGQSYSKNPQEIFLKINKDSWKGIELDIYFSENYKQFFITHDYPLTNDLPILDDILYAKNKKLWLDFKNLSDIRFSDLKVLKKKLKYIGIKNQVFIESQNLLKLKYLQDENINIIFNFPIIFKNKTYLFLIKYLTNILGFEYISVSVDSFLTIKSYFKPHQFFLFTVNSEDKICELILKQTVNVILTSINPIELKCK